MIRFSVDLGEVNLEEPARLTGEPVNVGEGKARLNFGERKDFCFLQIMKLIFGAVSQVKGRRNVFLSESERWEHFLFFLETNANYLCWSTWTLW